MLQTSSSLAFRSLLKTAAAASGLARPAPRLTGPTPPAAALHAALVAQDAPTFLVVPTDADVERLAGDARFFLSALQGLSPREAAELVLPFPSQEVDPYRGLTPHFEVASARAQALVGLASKRVRLVVASARALLPRLSDPARLAATSLTLRPGSEIPPQELAERLALAGFSPEDPVDEHGEFCVRGGVVDLFPASEAEPVRLEFIGDIVDSIRRYDAATQRSLAALDAVVVGPQRELLPDGESPDDGATLDRRRPSSTTSGAAGAALVVLEPDDVEDRGRSLDQQWRASAAEVEARGRRAAPFDQIAVGWDQQSAWLATGRRIGQLEIDDRARRAASTWRARRVSNTTDGSPTGSGRSVSPGIVAR